MTDVIIDDVSVAFGKARVLENLSLKIPSGSFFTLLGPSGCGKTTLLRVIAGFLIPQSGRVRFAERDVTTLPPHRRNTGLVFQDYALFPHKSVFENVAYGLRARNVNETTIKEKVRTYLGRVGLADFAKRAPSALSGGQRQRVALARSLVIDPDVLLMDEPLSALDANLRQEMRLFLGEIQREFGVTTVFVTHDQDEALAMSDQIALMQSGQIEQMASPTELHHQPRTVSVASFVGAANLLSAKVLSVSGDVAACELLGQKVEVAANGLQPTDPVKLCAHHQEASILAANGAAMSGLPGKVRTKSFLGGHSRYEVILASGENMTITQSTGFGTPQFEAGTDVVVQLSDNCCLVADV